MTWIELSLEHLKVLENLKSGHGVSSVAFIQFLLKELLQKLFKGQIHIFWTPLATSAWWQQFFTKELLCEITLELMHCNVNSTSSAVQHHYHLFLSQLLLHYIFRVLSALNRRAFWLKTQQKVWAHLLINDPCFHESLSHKMFMLLAPQRWYC